MSDMGTCLFVKAVLQKQQKGLPDDLFQFFTGIRKDILDVDRFFLLCCSFHHATILKIGMVKRMWELLYGMYTKMINGEFNLLYYKNILTVMRYYSSIYPDNIM